MPSGIQQRIRDQYYSRKLSRSSIEDEPELVVARLLVQKGHTALDIGANYGLFAKFLSEAVGRSGRVYSFEPVPTMFQTLSRNLSGSAYSNVTCFGEAVSEGTGRAHIEVPTWEDGSPNFYEASLEGGSTGNTERIMIPTVSIDDFVEREGIEKIDFIKCDVEGHEIAAIKGARRTLETHRPTIFLEVNQSLVDTEHGQAVAGLIASLGYEIHVLDGLAIRKWTPDFPATVNYILFPGKTASVSKGGTMAGATTAAV
ncbi:MAG: FkbM family methyltransferase [Verrucomicrobiae bacterium]|nr:FkbM family methyltransferase [Verrucomicrobiae bacterium]